MRERTRGGKGKEEDFPRSILTNRPNARRLKKKPGGKLQLIRTVYEKTRNATRHEIEKSRPEIKGALQRKRTIRSLANLFQLRKKEDSRGKEKRRN